MDYISWVLWLLGLLVASQYLLGPILVYLSQRIPHRYRFNLLDSETFLAARGEVFNLLHHQLQIENFRYIGSSELRMSHSVIYFSLYYCAGRKLLCTLMTAHATHANPTTQVEFTQMYADGTLLNVNNNAVLGAYPAWKIKEEYRFPQVNDLPELLQITDKLIKSRKPNATAVALAEGTEFETVENYLNEEVDRLIEIGWVSPKPSGHEHKLTIKGAILMTWKMCWPIKSILNKRDARKSKIAYDRD